MQADRRQTSKKITEGGFLLRRQHLVQSVLTYEQEDIQLSWSEFWVTAEDVTALLQSDSSSMDGYQD